MSTCIGAIAPPQPKAEKKPTLFTTDSAKTRKGEKLGYTTLIMYMSPYKQNSLGKNICPNASAGCASACLFSAGRGRFSNVQQARINRTEFFLRHPEAFMESIAAEIIKAMRKVDHDHLVVRLNGTSDLPWENIRYGNHANIMEAFPTLQFYDYTKSLKRLLKSKPSNYHLTFSRSETNHEECLMALAAGYNVAAVFASELPEEYLGYPVVDGDQHDLTFLHPDGVILGLKAKGDAKTDTSGFVIRNY